MTNPWPIIKSDFLLNAFFEQSVLNMKNNFSVTLFLLRRLHSLETELTPVFNVNKKIALLSITYLDK
jgi:hypothetical protein